MLGRRLRMMRLYNKYTQQNMADFLDLTLNGYQKYEQGRNAPPWETLVKIADIFNVPVDYLLGRDEYLKSIGIEIDIPEPPKKKSQKSDKNQVQKN